MQTSPGQTGPGQTSPGIVAVPHAATIDVARRIALHGFAPGEQVTGAATLRQNDTSTWRSVATVVTDADGSIDVATAAPVSGSYAGVSPMGLVWSMQQTGEAVPPGTPSRESWSSTAARGVSTRPPTIWPSNFFPMPGSIAASA